MIGLMDGLTGDAGGAFLECGRLGAAFPGCDMSYLPPQSAAESAQYKKRCGEGIPLEWVGIDWNGAARTGLMDFWMGGCGKFFPVGNRPPL